MPKMLIFDIWGRYAHYKKIYATTSALSYIIPSKTSLYGYIGAVLGLSKEGNEYLNYFPPSSCRLSIKLMRPIIMQRINTNLHPHNKGLIKANQNRKPTTVEYVYRPMYRIFFTHEDKSIIKKLGKHLREHTSIYTPTLGLANLLSNFEYINESEVKEVFLDEPASIDIQSVIPREAFEAFDLKPEVGNEIIEYSQFALEMNAKREVTARTDILIDRIGNPVQAFVNRYNTYEHEGKQHHIILF
jgi:CRISPR-associated protein Cas5h